MQKNYYISKSALMHACLAHLSPEIQTIDDIIQARPGSAPYSNAPRIPTEILLLIRESLFPLVTANLVQKSTTALEAYEHSLRNLLCPDCIVYNLDIYGPNIWQWEQFHGACACLETIESPPNEVAAGGSVQQQPPKGLVATLKPTPNPKQFTNAQHWLETYLSREAATLLAKSRGNHHPQVGATTTTAVVSDRVVVNFDNGRTLTAAITSTHNNNQPLTPDPVDIWKTVAQILREFDCEYIHHGPVGDSSTSAPASSLFHTESWRRDFVRIMPVSISAGECPEPTSSWRSQAILRKVVRELCLDCVEPFGTHHRDPSSFKRLLWRSTPANLHSSTKDHVQVFLGFVASFVAGCLSLPITCTTIVVSIFYFYSRPRSFRIF